MQAALCFDFSSSTLQAGHAYERAGDYPSAVSRYFSKRDYENACRLVFDHREALAARLVERVLDGASLLYAKQHDFSKLLAIHGSVDRMKEWLDDYGFGMFYKGFYKQETQPWL